MLKKSLLILLFSVIVFSQMPDGAKYLIICDNDFVEDLQPLADWKTQKGYPAYIAPLSETGSSSSNIESYIQDAYDTWDPAPEFVLLVGNTTIIPMIYGGRTEYGRFNCDWQYGEMTGDIFNDIQVGRLPASNNTRLRPMLEKIMRYEINPLLDDTDDHWLSKGITIIMEDGDDDDSLYWANTDTAALGMTRNGYTHIDRFSTYRGNDADDIHESVADGRGLILFRGQSTTNWWSPFDVNPWTMENGLMNPIVLSITCHTISDGGSSQAGTWWLEAGYDLDTGARGAVGFVGTTTSISHGAHLRGEVAEGIVNSFYSDTTNDLGRAVEAGRMNEYLLYGDEPQYTGHLLFGDPEMDIRTKPPVPLSVDHFPIIPIGATEISIDVAGTSGPLENALVCVTDFENTYSTGQTNSSGHLDLPIIAAEVGTLTVTITAKNYYPSESHVLIIGSGSYPNVCDYVINDLTGGNADGYLNPGEEVELLVYVTNNGVDDAASVDGELICSDPYMEILSSSASYGALRAGIDTVSREFSLRVDAECPKDHILDMSFNMTADGTDFSDNSPDVPVYQPQFSINSFANDDSNPLGNGNDLLEPGETGMFDFTFENNSPSSIDDIKMVFRSVEPGLNFDDSLAEISRVLGDSEFHLAGSGLPITMYEGAIFDESESIVIEVTGDGGTYTYYDTLEFDIPTGGPGRSFTGPDEYGYYCYDDTDEMTGRSPDYDWFDISSVGTNIDGVSNRDDDIVTIEVPIDLVYYGETFDRLSIATNGFISFGTEDWHGGGGSGHEQPIPTVGQAAAIVAPFWNDLDPGDGGNVYGYHDSDNHRVIIQYDEVQHYGISSSTRQTFQIIITDPDYYTTPTGDSEILIQYERYNEHDRVSHTIGIESPDELMGIQYEYHGSWAPGAEPVENERALLFTTNPPVAPDNRWLVVTGIEIDDTEEGNSDGEANFGETFDIIMNVKNQGTLNASDVTVEILHGSDLALFTDSAAVFGNIASSATANNESNPFTISIDDVSLADTLIYLYAVLSSDDGAYSRTTKISISVKSAMEAMSYEIYRGWNMFSYPFDNTAHKDELFPDAVDEIFKYVTSERRYVVADIIEPGFGYWVLYGSNSIVSHSDSPWLTSIDLSLERGWNLIGTLSSNVDATVITSSSAVVGPVYKYNGTGYDAVDILEPGFGYWILASEEVDIDLP